LHRRNPDYRNAVPFALAANAGLPHPGGIRLGPWFESVSLQRRVFEPSRPRGSEHPDELMEALELFGKKVLPHIRDI
jgi:hypothetical protein